MLTRFLIWSLFFLVIIRTVGRLVRGISEGISGRPSPGSGRGRGTTAAATKGEAMARDPVCGTYVVPSRALTTRGKDGQVYFCSDTCRQAYLSR